MLLGIKRIYDKTEMTDGRRILVDRLWPRGVKRSTANIDIWMKEIAPSDKLRTWFAHDIKKWPEFEKRYRRELERNESLSKLINIVKASDVTFVYSSNDQEHNNAVVLEKVINEKIRKES
ncbi:DUF488 family protein [Candidatus Marsarchaeota archaeon]|nr:DUF488 family protein [Candidatus Marsarchaeota archaeon]